MPAEEALAAQNRDYHDRPLCPELECQDSEPVIGVCPECGLASGYLEIGAQTWHYCDEHKVRWHTFNRRPAKHDVDAWKANADKLAAYRIVHSRECRQPGGKPSLTQLNIALQSGIRRDREKAGLPA